MSNRFVWYSGDVRYVNPAEDEGPPASRSKFLVSLCRGPVYKALAKSLEDKVMALVRRQGYSPLYRLGAALGCTPAQLGEAVNSLRRQGKLSGSAAEGRGASDEERRWWVADISGSGKLGAVTPRG